MTRMDDILRSARTIAVVGLSNKRFRPSYGVAEYMKRAWKLDDDAVAYWRAYEDFRGFVTEPVWDLVRELAVGQFDSAER